MNTPYTSTYLRLLQFLSSVSYNSLSIGLLHPWLNLLLGIFFWIVNGIVFLVSLSDSSLLVNKNTTDHANWCIPCGTALWPSDSTSGNISEILIQKDISTLMYIAALFIDKIAKIQKQPKCPSVDEWIKKLWYIYTME